MKIIPAIDLMGGAYVRLRQGRFHEATCYGDDPVAVAIGFARAGASLIHLVDLDGARTGHPIQADLVRTIAASVTSQIEVGGGLRTLDQIAAYLEQGVARVVLGSAAVQEPALLQAAVEVYGGRVVLGIDVRAGRVAIGGWTEVSSRDALSLAREMAGLGLQELIYTDISRDGMMNGPDLTGLARLVVESGLSVIASGGISSMADLESVATAGASGAIIGKALYDGRVDLRDAILSLEVIT